MLPSRGLKKKRGGGGSIFLCGRMKKNKQFQIWFLWEVERASRRVCRQTHLHHPAFSSSSSSPLPSICSFCEGVFLDIRYLRFSSFLLTDGGRSTPSQLGDSDFPATSPPSPPARGYKSPNPFTPRCGIGLKKTDFAQRSDHQPPAVPKNHHL